MDAETKESTRKTKEKKNWMEGIRKAMNERNLSEGQWEDAGVVRKVKNVLPYKDIY